MELLRQIGSVAESCLKDDLVAVVLLGSAATGDFVWSGECNTLQFWSDIDAVTFVKDGARVAEYESKLAALAGKVRAATLLFRIDMSTGLGPRHRKLPKTYGIVEAKQAGCVLAGSEVVLEYFPDRFESVSWKQALLFNLWTAVLHWTDQPDEVRRSCIQQVLARLVLDWALVPFARRGVCVLGHRRRVERLKSEGRLSPSTMRMLDTALEVRSGRSANVELADYVLFFSDQFAALDGGPPLAWETAETLVRRFRAWLPPRLPRRCLAEAARSGGDVRWLLRRKEAHAGAIAFKLLQAFAHGVPPDQSPELCRLLSEFCGRPIARPSSKAELKWTYWTGLTRLYPQLEKKSARVRELVDHDSSVSRLR